MSDTTVARRDFIRTVGAATAATALSYSRILGANERVQMGLIGCGGRGIGNMGNFLKLGSVDFIAFCDVWGTAMDRAKKATPDAKTVGDYRAMLEMKELDAVMIATPDHWHLAQSVDAMNAGKDVYVEKPLTLRNEEGPEIIKAARLNKRVCQVGMQQRSGRHYIEAKEQYFDTGRLGRITLVRTWWHGNTFHLRRAPAELQTQPADLDWAGFVGPLPWRDYDPQQFYNWRAYLDYGGGQITDLFTHWIDVVHMFMGQDIPLSAVASGGIYAYKDGRTAPDTIHVLLEYPGPFTATFEATLVPGITGAGIEFCGTEGRLTITRGAYEFFPVPVRSPGKPAGEPESTLVRATSSLDQDHMGDFIDCVKSRKLPKGDVLIGHRSAQASHLGNIAYVEKRRIAFDPIREQILP
jgi:predicted dehydrogenase